MYHEYKVYLNVKYKKDELFDVLVSVVNQNLFHRVK